jgi:phosphoribosylaminoimidazole-succinocarboxamide synthase
MEKAHSVRIEDLQRRYAYGDCATLAAALGRMCTLPIVEFYSGSEMFHVALVTEGTSLKDDRFLDAYGEASVSQIRRPYGITGKVDVMARTESELKAMSVFTEEDVGEATTAANELIKTGVLTLPTAEFVEQRKPSIPPPD